jgi:excisionase family DNA binding protein
MMEQETKSSRAAGDFFVEAIAEAVASRLKGAHITRRLLSLEQAAEYLGLSEDAVRDLVGNGKLRPARPTRKLQFDVFDLDKLIEESKR